MLNIPKVPDLVRFGCVTRRFQSTADAQALLIILFGDKLSTDKFQMGINADLVWSGYTGLGSNSPRSSWAFGAYGELKLSSHWRLQPELTIKTPGGAKNLDVNTTPGPFDMPTGDAALDSIRDASTLTRSTNYVTLPLLVKYVAGPVAFSAGPQIGFLTGATDRLEGEVDRGDLTLETGSKDFLNSFDAGLVGGISFALDPGRQMRSLRIDAKFYYGLTDVVKDNAGAAARNWMFFIGLDIPVGGKDAVQGDGDNGSD